MRKYNLYFKKLSNLDRIKQIKIILNHTPDDEFLNYALAIEYVSIDKLSSALKLFEKLVIKSPQYFATYYHLGKLYEKLNDPVNAKKIYEDGLLITKKLNENHAFNELRGALDELLY